jgi:membrane protein YdbS with pleckstrin-like domain
VITLKCDNCEKPFQIEDDAAGEKVACPYCGDINRVPRGDSAPPAGSAPAESPPAPVKAAGAIPASPSEPERTITVVRQAMFRAHPFWYLLMALAFVVGVALAVLARTSQQVPPWSMWIGLVMAAAAALWWLVWWAAPHRWVKLTISNKRTVRQEGIIVRRTSEVLHNHIRNVKIEQSFLERILGVGSLSIDSAGGSEEEMVEIQMNKIARPYHVKEILDRHRRM